MKKTSFQPPPVVLSVDDLQAKQSRFPKPTGGQRKAAAAEEPIRPEASIVQREEGTPAIVVSLTIDPPSQKRSADGQVDRIIVKIRVALIDRSPYQNRSKLDENYISDLAENMRVDGLNNPITVRPKLGGRYELLAGENRHAAAGLLNWTEIDAEIRTVDDNKAARLVFFDNYFHKPLQDYEVFKGFTNLIELGKSTGISPSLRSLAKEAGISSSQMGRLFAFAKLPERVREILDERPDILQANAAESLIRFCGGAQEHLVVDAIEQLRDGKLTQGRAAVWIEHRVSARPTKSERTLTSIDGKQFAKLERTGQRLTVKIAAGIDSSELEDAVFHILRQHADKVEIA